MCIYVSVKVYGDQLYGGFFSLTLFTFILPRVCFYICLRLLCSILSPPCSLLSSLFSLFSLQVKVVINVASNCGLTKGHNKELFELRDKFGPEKFEVRTLSPFFLSFSLSCLIWERRESHYPFRREKARLYLSLHFTRKKIERLLFYLLWVPQSLSTQKGSLLEVSILPRSLILI